MEQQKPQEMTWNYFRLLKLTTIEGTKAIRKTVLKRLPGGQTLHMILKQKEEFIRSLNKGQKSIINNEQLKILYPTDGSICNLSAIDMTLWCAFARNLIKLPRGTSVHWGDDDHPPLPGQEEWYHDVIRIRLTRNNLFHLQSPETDNQTFQQLWNYVSGALRRLDSDIDFESYKNEKYDPIAAKELEFGMKEQVYQEMNDVLKEELRRRRHLFIIIILVVVALSLALIAEGCVIAFLKSITDTTCGRGKTDTTCGRGKRSEIIGRSGILTFLPREGWNAEKPSKEIDNLTLPVSIVEYTHTADAMSCTDCCSLVYNIQYLHMHFQNYEDIGMHYFIDKDGLVYEGRDPKKIPSAVYGWNRKIISIAFIGNFMYERPSIPALDAFNLLLEYLVIKGYANSSFVLYALCEMLPSLGPGKNLYDTVNKNLGGYEYFKYVAHRNESHCNFK